MGASPPQNISVRLHRICSFFKHGILDFLTTYPNLLPTHKSPPPIHPSLRKKTHLSQTSPLPPPPKQGPTFRSHHHHGGSKSRSRTRTLVLLFFSFRKTLRSEILISRHFSHVKIYCKPGGWVLPSSPCRDMGVGRNRLCSGQVGLWIRRAGKKRQFLLDHIPLSCRYIFKHRINKKNT